MPKTSRGKKRIRAKAKDKTPIKKGVPNWMATGAAAHFDRRLYAEYKEAQLGKLGAASEVRHIDPAEYESLMASKKEP